MAWSLWQRTDQSISKKEYQESKRGLSQTYNVGDHLVCKEAEGICDKIEWSEFFKTWCYHVVGKKSYWIYQTDRTLRKFGCKPKLAPVALPDPVSIME